MEDAIGGSTLQDGDGLRTRQDDGEIQFFSFLGFSHHLSSRFFVVACQSSSLIFIVIFFSLGLCKIKKIS